ncbi:hypothetical protein GQ53DRAFT_670950 [Thozetella sp. PMI_491]|nr:hypothetical protein GQ53DRAFT_670950 [Thozetella sp. PMI_491]
MDLNAAAILANGSTAGQDLGAMQQHLHNPHSPSQLAAHAHATHAVDPSLTGKATEDMAADSGYLDLNVESQLAKRLSAWPGLRLAHQRRPEQQLNLQRRSNVEALFAHIAGKLAKVQCKNCHKGHGPWNSCVIVEGQMCGSCANCWFNASGARCSFHETRQNVIPAGSASHGHIVDPNGNAYAVPQQMLGPQQAARLASLSLNATPLTNDATLRYNIDRAVNEVRAADERARHLISIDIAAKQLALHIVQYEEYMANNQAQQVQHQQVGQVQQLSQVQQQVPQGPQGQQPQGLGDDTTL